MLYLDTSVMVSALTNEADTAAAQSWLSRQGIQELNISDWMVTELPSALSIKLQTGQPGPEHRASALAAFTRLASETLGILPVDQASFRTAARFADQHVHGLRAGDSLHLAICADRGATLCTLDRRLGEAAPLVGVESVLP